MKIPSVILFVSSIASALAASASVCPMANAHASGAALQEILKYKQSEHQIMAAYYRSWRDVASNPKENRAAMDDLPDCLDIAFVFCQGSEPDTFFTTLRDKYAPALKKRGTKVVRTIAIDAILDEKYANNIDGYQALAKHLFETYVVAHGLDGLDIDVERRLSKTQLKKAVGVFDALSRFIGPRSGTGKLFIYDTNQDGTTSLFQAVHSYIDFVLVQSYGRSLKKAQGTFNTYKPYISGKQYLIGFSFYEERGPAWGDVDVPTNTSRAYNYALWQPQGARKGGIFSYAVDRDGVREGSNDLVPTDYSWTRQLISAMNP